jgi:hypothetical protein
MWSLIMHQSTLMNHIKFEQQIEVPTYVYFDYKWNRYRFNPDSRIDPASVQDKLVELNRKYKELTFIGRL